MCALGVYGRVGVVLFEGWDEISAAAFSSPSALVLEGRRPCVGLRAIYAQGKGCSIHELFAPKLRRVTVAFSPAALSGWE
jgi:hypothetical protein